MKIFGPVVLLLAILIVAVITNRDLLTDPAKLYPDSYNSAQARAQSLNGWVHWSTGQSMLIEDGWLVMVYDFDGIQRGDLIAYEPGILHRALYKTGNIWTVQGDANNRPDNARVFRGNYIGTAKEIVPFK